MSIFTNPVENVQHFLEPLYDGRLPGTNEIAPRDPNRYYTTVASTENISPNVDIGDEAAPRIEGDRTGLTFSTSNGADQKAPSDLTQTALIVGAVVLVAWWVLK